MFEEKETPITKIIGIKTNKGYYITDQMEAGSYGNSSLKYWLVNGAEPVTTFHSKWFFVEAEPATIEKKQSQPAINKRWELKDKSLADKFDETWPESASWWDDDDDCYEYAAGFIHELYEFKQELQPDILVDVPFEFFLITEIDEMPNRPDFKYKTVDNWGKNAMAVTAGNIKHSMVAQIITPELLLHGQPCSLSSKETYDIIRAYVKENLDGRHAEISSDYNFCFQVNKRVQLAKAYEYKTEQKIRGKRKPVVQTKIQSARTVKIFEMTYSPENYKGYTPIKPFTGDSMEDLKANIDSYLAKLVAMINEPVKDCPCCEGVGVIFDK